MSQMSIAKHQTRMHGNNGQLLISRWTSSANAESSGHFIYLLNNLLSLWDSKIHRKLPPVFSIVLTTSWALHKFVKLFSEKENRRWNGRWQKWKMKTFDDFPPDFFYFYKSMVMIFFGKRMPHSVLRDLFLMKSFLYQFSRRFGVYVHGCWKLFSTFDWAKLAVPLLPVFETHLEADLFL